jgi:hypothetical protein
MRSHPKAVTVRFSLPEFAAIEDHARSQGESPAEWVRLRCLHALEWEERWVGEVRALLGELRATQGLVAELGGNHRATQQLVAELVRELVAHVSNGDREEAVDKIRAIFEKAEASRSQKQERR